MSSAVAIAQPEAEDRSGAPADGRQLKLPTISKLLFVLPNISSGGAERVATALCNHWRKRGLDVIVATFESEDTPPYYPLDPGLKVHRLGVPADPGSIGGGLWQTGKRVRALTALIRAERPLVVISFLTKVNIITLLAAPRGTPVIISERNNPNRQRYNALWRAARAWTFPKAYALVAMTQGALDAYPARERPNSAVIPNPVVIPEGLVRRGDGRTLAAVGRLTRQKRFDLLLDAFARIAGAHPDWRLIIWGEGEERAALEAQRERLGLADRVAMPGRTESPCAWLESADALALSSDFEGWGNVIAEAMAAGVPVIATDCDFGPGAMIENERSGLLVPANDADALARGLSQLLGDEALRARLSAAARIRAQAWDIAAVADRWENLAAAAVKNAGAEAALR